LGTCLSGSLGIYYFNLITPKISLNWVKPMIFCGYFIPQIIFSQLEVAGLETEAGKSTSILYNTNVVNQLSYLIFVTYSIY
jgi:hypothetical protein